MSGSRTYVSKARARHAQDTHDAILRAAADLFTELGYARTTLQAISKRAEVAVNTIYSSVGGKPAIILALAQGGADDETAQGTVEQTSLMSDPIDILRQTASGVCSVRQLKEVSLNVLLSSETSDPDVAAAADLARNIVKSRLAAIALHLKTVVGLRPELSVRTVEDILWFYFGFDASRTLRALGWQWEEIAAWLAQQAIAALVETKPHSSDLPL
ncbi:TetR/AcrR family transcriptional regulator [Rhizobium leguminosarum]|uniref:TetR/AcrR family transcriptional regulator n=1 Tax=Rhizobium TaxID=379 RepID=UPI0013EE7CD9|nr:TetR/AcrR family transcriptional regulator [Rhizobium leguminosarum]